MERSGDNARSAAVISSRLWGVYDVADEGYLVRRGHVICSMSPTQPETNLLVVAVFRFCVSCVNAVKLHVNDADVLVSSASRRPARDNRRSARKRLVGGVRVVTVRSGRSVASPSSRFKQCVPLRRSVSTPGRKRRG